MPISGNSVGGYFWGNQWRPLKGAWRRVRRAEAWNWSTTLHHYTSSACDGSPHQSMCAWQLATTVSLLLSPTLISLYIPGIVFLALRAVLIEQLFPQNFPLFFFPRKTGKARKTGNISKVWKFNRGQNTWKASHSNIWKKKKRKNMEMQNITRTKKSGNLVKTSFDKNGPTLDALICGATQTISMRVSKKGLLLVWTDKGADWIPYTHLSTKYIACELYLR